MITQAYKICTNCVMDTSSPDISFDKNGVCNYCFSYRNKIQNNFNIRVKNLELEKIIKKMMKNILKQFIKKLGFPWLLWVE